MAVVGHAANSKFSNKINRLHVLCHQGFDLPRLGDDALGVGSTFGNSLRYSLIQG